MKRAAADPAPGRIAGCVAPAVHAVVLLGAAALGIFAPACANECSFDDEDGDLPAAALECPAGNLCYRGSCFASCNAGREGVERCSSDDDCSGVRPVCNLTTGFCSSCERGEGCVPTLGICRPVSPAREVPVPPLPDDNDFVPDGPLDARLPDGGLVRFTDAGEAPTPQGAATVAVHFEMAREVPIPDGARCVTFPEPAAEPRPRVAVRAWNVSSVDRDPGAVWRADLAPPGTESLASTELRDGQCEVRRIETATRAVNLNLGEVAFEDPRDNERVLDNWTARFTAGAYEALPNDGAADPRVFIPNVRFIAEIGQLQLFGLGRSGFTNGSFGAELDLPFELLPNCATVDTLGSDFRIGVSPQPVLVLGWLDPLNGTTGQEVYLRIDGTAAGLELVCEETESSGAANIVVSSSILTSFAAALEASGAVAPGDVLDLEFGRRNLKRVQIDPAPGQLVFGTAEVSFRYVQSISLGPD